MFVDLTKSEITFSSSEPYDWIDWTVFRPDSERVASIVNIGGKIIDRADGSYTVKGGKIYAKIYGGSKPYDQIENFQFSPDGKNYAFVATDYGLTNENNIDENAELKNYKKFIVVDGKEGKPFHKIGHDFSEYYWGDNGRVAYAGVSLINPTFYINGGGYSGQKYYVVYNDKCEGPFNDDYIFSFNKRDGIIFGTSEKFPGNFTKWYLRKNEWKSEAYDAIGSAMVSKKGKFIYNATKYRKTFIYVNGEKFGPVNIYGEMSLNEEGNSLIFFEQKDQKVYLCELKI